MYVSSPVTKSAAGITAVAVPTDGEDDDVGIARGDEDDRGRVGCVKVLEAHDLCGLFANYLTQPGTVRGCPIENRTSIGSNLSSYGRSDAGHTIDYQEE